MKQLQHQMIMESFCNLRLSNWEIGSVTTDCLWKGQTKTPRYVPPENAKQEFLYSHVHEANLVIIMSRPSYDLFTSSCPP